MTRVNARKWAELMLDEEAYAPLAQEIIAMDEVIALLVEALGNVGVAAQVADIQTMIGKPVRHSEYYEAICGYVDTALTDPRVTDATSAQDEREGV